MFDGVGEHAVGIDGILVALADRPHMKVGDLRQQHVRPAGRSARDCWPASPRSPARRSRSRLHRPSRPRDRGHPTPGCVAGGRGRRRRCSGRCVGRHGGRAHRDRGRRPLDSRRPAPAISPVAACQGAMWIMLLHSTAQACSTGHAADCASSATAGRTLARPLSRAQSSMLARAELSGSLGWKMRSGRAAAKCMTCSPEPLATSSTRPLAGRCRRSTSRMGWRLRAAAGAWRLIAPTASPARHAPAWPVPRSR